VELLLIVEHVLLEHVEKEFVLGALLFATEKNVVMMDVVVNVLQVVKEVLSV